MSERTYCADLCTAAEEPMFGTADHVDVWLLLEYKPSWEAKAIVNNSLSRTTRDWLRSTVETLAGQGLKARPQFIRRPEIDTDQTSLFVGTSDALFEFSSTGYAGLTDLNIVELIASGDGPRCGTNQYFVCTNGKRDLCCARYGLPAYRQLRDSVGDRVWQTTHLGGHRFAPNVLVLPQGVLYGRVVPEDVESFVTCVEAGDISRPHLRGRSAFPKIAQAAEALTADAVIELVAIDGDDDVATVSLRTAAGVVTVSVERSPEALEILTSCGEDAAKAIQPYQKKVA